MIEALFFDTYAIIEILKGNPNYKKYDDKIFLTTKLNIFELYYALLKDFDERIAKEITNKYYKFVVDFDLSIIESAAKFRLENKSKNLSMTDCIGYKVAEFWKVKFLTGDMQFEGRTNVEYVK